VSRSSPAPRGSRRHIIRWPVSDRPPHDGWHSTSFVVTDRGPNSAARWRSSVPLARPLSPPDPNPLSGLRLIRQVLRELRVILCQTPRAHVGWNPDIRNFCPKVVTFSTGLFTQNTTSHHLVASFPQTGTSQPSAVTVIYRAWSPNMSGSCFERHPRRHPVGPKSCFNLRLCPSHAALSSHIVH
jgi:hypothetical protein